MFRCFFEDEITHMRYFDLSQSELMFTRPGSEVYFKLFLASLEVDFTADAE